MMTMTDCTRTFEDLLARNARKLELQSENIAIRRYPRQFGRTNSQIAAEIERLRCGARERSFQGTLASAEDCGGVTRTLARRNSDIR